MFDKSATTSLVPGAAIRQPRTEDEHSSLTLSKSRSSHSSFIASMPCSTTCGSSEGRGKFCGWKMRPASRPVREAPQNWMMPRSRSSDEAASRMTLYLAGEVAEACCLISSSSRTFGSRSPLSRADTVPLVMSSGANW